MVESSSRCKWASTPRAGASEVGESGVRQITGFGAARVARISSGRRASSEEGVEATVRQAEGRPGDG